MSIFLGAQLSQVLNIFERGESKGTAGKGILSFGIPNLPNLEKDATDRNRTSPFAFTGNRFEFRAVGSSQPIAFPLMIINTAVAEALHELNHQVKQDEAQSGDILVSIIKVVQKTLSDTKSIRFEGNGYSDEWKQEAAQRGLPQAEDTVAALKIWEEPQVQSLFVNGGIFSTQELEARLHIRHEQYQKALNIEAQVLREMTETLLIPSILSDIGDKSQSIKYAMDAGQSTLTKESPIGQMIGRQVNLLNQAQSEVMKLRELLGRAENQSDMHARTEIFGRQVRPAMDQLRYTLDELEELTDATYWPIPKYRELLAPLS
jgi:glutamine synthetase